MKIYRFFCTFVLFCRKQQRQQKLSRSVSIGRSTSNPSSHPSSVRSHYTNLLLCESLFFPSRPTSQYQPTCIVSRPKTPVPHPKTLHLHTYSSTVSRFLFVKDTVLRRGPVGGCRVFLLPLKEGGRKDIGCTLERTEEGCEVGILIHTGCLKFFLFLLEGEGCFFDRLIEYNYRLLCSRRSYLGEDPQKL